MVSQTTGGSAQSPRVRALPNLPKATLVERTDITEDLFVIKLEPEQGPLKFKAGQYCTLGLEGIERAYSIVSAPHEPLLEVFVEVVPEGELTPRMHLMKIGDKMSIRPRAKGRKLSFRDRFPICPKRLWWSAPISRKTCL